MTIAPDAAAIHQLVDQIEPADYGTVYVILRRLAINAPVPLPVDEAGLSRGEAGIDTSGQASPRRRFSFTGIGEGPSDLSSRAKDYLRDSVRDET